MLARLLLTVFAFAAATAKEKEGGVTLIMRGENPVVIVGRQEFFTDYGKGSSCSLGRRVFTRSSGAHPPPPPPAHTHGTRSPHAGAICLDEEGNAITHEIQYGGHIIDTSMPGIYKVHYTCRGQKETRTVVVKEGAASQQLGARANCF
jgi:hypothetical protein